MNKKLIRKMLTATGGNLFSGNKGYSSRMTTTGGAGYIPPHTQLDKATIRQNLYDNLSPHSYQSLSDAFKSILGTNTGATHTLEDVSVNSYAEQPIDDAIWATYLGIPKSKRHKKSPELVRSKYTPSMGKDDVTYYKFPLIDGINYVVEEGTSLPIGSNKLTNMDSSSARVGNVGDYTIGHGYDNQGEYVSMYDKWDINPFKGSYRMTGLLGDIGNSLFGNIDDLSFGIGKPVHLYDRIYLDDYYGVKEPTHATYLPEVTVIGKKKKEGKMNTIKLFKEGGQIRKMQTAAGGPLQLTPEELKYLEWSKMTPELKREYRTNRAKSYLLSGPNITNFWEAFQTYIGNRDPKNPHLQTGEAPNPGMRNPKLIVSSVLTINKFKNILKNYNPYAYRKPKLPEIKISDKIIDDVKNIKIDPNNLFTDNFIKYLEKQTGRKIKRIPYKNTKDGNIYKEGFSFVDENGKEVAHIAGNLKGKNIWVESSYVDPEFRHKGLGKLMYFDFNDYAYNTYGTTLHSSALQRVGYVDGGGMSPSNRLWKSLTDNKLATTEGSGFDWWNVMTDPSKIKTVYRKQGGKMNIIKLFKNGGLVRKMLTAAGGPLVNESTRVEKPIIAIPKKINKIQLSDDNSWEKTDNNNNEVNVYPNLRNDKYIQEFFLYDYAPRFKRLNSFASRDYVNAALNIYKSTPINIYNEDNNVGGYKTGGERETYNNYFTNLINLSYGPLSIYLNEKFKLNRPTLVHELTHAFRLGYLGITGDTRFSSAKYPIYNWINKEIGNEYYGSGYSNSEKDILNNTYNMEGYKINYDPLWEKGTTNTEVRFRLWKELYDQLGRRPSLEETDRYIRTYNGEKLLKIVRNANAYGLTMYNNGMLIDLIKNALINVAQNNSKNTYQLNDQTYYAKQGGMLEFLKKGSGIHIKKKNRGKFTSYCGGKVTDECILKGKNSSNPAIRKRATFADNARHFKHRLGGSIVEAFKLRRLILNSLNNMIND